MRRIRSLTKAFRQSKSLDADRTTHPKLSFGSNKAGATRIPVRATALLGSWSAPSPDIGRSGPLLYSATKPPWSRKGLLLGKPYTVTGEPTRFGFKAAYLTDFLNRAEHQNVR